MKQLKKSCAPVVVMVIIMSLFAEITISQDLIVTYQNEELNCRITKIRGEKIYFTLHNRSHFLLLDDVEYYEYNYFRNRRNDYGDSQIFFEDDASRVRVALHGGWSYRTAKIGKNVPSEYIPYTKELRNGYSLGMNAAYYFRKAIGTGLKVNYFNAKNTYSQVIPSTTGYSTVITKDNISIYFIGPTFGTRLLNDNKRNGFIFNFGLGYLGFYDKGSIAGQNVILKNGTIGAAWDIGYDIGLSRNFALGINLSYIAGFLTSIKRQYAGPIGVITEKIEMEKEDYENLSTINLSVGIRFNAGRSQ